MCAHRYNKFHYWVFPPVQREVEVDVPAIDPSQPVREPPCPLNRRAPVRMSFRVSSKAVGKESRYEFLRRKLSMRRRQSSDADEVRKTNQTPTPGKGNQGSVYPETGERKAQSSITGSRRPQYTAVQSPGAPLYTTQQLGGGTLSQPAYLSYDYHSQTTQKRAQRKVSPLTTGHLYPLSERPKHCGQQQFPQSSRESNSEREAGRWYRASSAATPNKNSGYSISPPGRSGARTAQGYRSTSSSQTGYFQSVDQNSSLSYYSTTSPNIVRAPHIRREEQVITAVSPTMDIYSRGRHMSSRSESNRSRRRHRSQSPGDFLSRSHNEHRYCQGRVRSHSTDRYLEADGEEHLDENPRQRANSVDLDLLSPVDNTYRVNKRRAFKNNHELQLAKQNRGGSTYTTATSEYVRKPKRKNAARSQSTEHLDQTDNKMEVVTLQVNPPEDKPVFHLSQKHTSPAKESIFATDSGEMQVSKASTDSGYTSPIESGMVRGMRESTEQKEYSENDFMLK